MKEDYLHFLWRMRFLPSRNLLLSNEQEVEIIDFGQYNENESGPDFLHCKIILNGLLWFGSIEFHLKSSDWYKHGHQKDPAYENVILHVVWEEDQDVIISNRILPTLVLANYIDEKLIINPSSSYSKSINLACAFSLGEVDIIHIEKQKELMIIERLKRKTASLKFQKDGFAQVLYELLASSFGSKVNKEPFSQLSKQIPIKRLLKIDKSKRAKVICDTSGLDFKEERQNIKTPLTTKLHDWQWKRKGLRPQGFPEIRVKQFAYFIQHFDFDFGFLQLPFQELLNYLYASFALVELKEDSSFKPIHFSKGFMDLVIINSFVPFLYWLGETRGEINWQNKAFDLLQAISPENNHLTKLLKTTGFVIHSAYDSQALLELYNTHCTHKKCLTCAIGNEILGQ